MKLKFILGMLAVFCIVHEISATFKLCSCMGEGTDVCNCKKSLKAPRPYPIQAPQFKQKPLIKTICKEYSEPSPPAPAFKPIGDACNCGQTIVKPAPHPILKPCPCMKGLPKWEFKHTPSCSCTSCTAYKDSGEKQDHECGQLKPAPKEYTFEFENRKKPAPQKPRYSEADVVSVAIARRLSNSAKNSISERQLQYGSQKEPTPNRKEENKVIAVNEDHLYDTRGHVLEIKSSMFRKPESSESEEESDEQPKRKPVAFSPNKLKYDEIGYGAYHQHNPRYVVVKNTEANHDCSNSQKQQKSHHGKKSKSCGCPKDLLVEETSLSEQSMTLENDSSDQYLQQRTYFST